MGTAAFTAPELLERGTKPTIKSDMYSLGMVMTEFSLPNRSTPWEGEVANSSVIYDYARRGERPTVKEENLTGLSEDIARRWMKLLRACWDQDPSNRPSATHVRLEITSMSAEEPGDDYTTFRQWRDDHPDIHFVPLINHQGMALELVDEVVSSFVSQNKSMSEDLRSDLASNFQSTDGSNACVYLCTKIADELLKSDNVSDKNKFSFIQNVAEETIRSLPKCLNPLRDVRDFADVDDALKLMNQHCIINTQYITKELLEKQSSDNLEDKQKHLKLALKSLQRSTNSEGKAFAVYTCHPYAILVGVLSSNVLIIDTHKVSSEVGGEESGLMVLLDNDSNQNDNALDSVVHWISLRMKKSIRQYSTELHSLVQLEAKDVVRSDVDDSIVVSDTEDADLLNASAEIERNLQSVDFDDCVMADSEDADLLNASTEIEQNLRSVASDDECVELKHTDNNEVLNTTQEMKGCVSPSISDRSNDKGHRNYSLPEELPAVEENDLMVWKGHLTKFGLNSLNDFQIQAIQGVQLGRDVIVVQPTGSGKSLCFQLPSLFERGKKMVVVISPTISLINSQIEGLRKVNIDAIALGRPAGEEAQLNHDRLFNSDSGTSYPSIVFMTPEHFVNRVSYNLERIRKNVKLLVLEEVHKMFDRNSDFRSSYDFFKGIKESFSCVPVMTLTATLSQAQLESLCADYLKNPVLIKGSINRSNVKLNIKSYVISRKKTKSSSDEKTNRKEEMWSQCAKEIKNISGEEYAIVYMDFRSDVEKMTSSLKLLLGEENVRPYYGRGMTHDVKKKTDSDFRSKEFQV